MASDFEDSGKWQRGTHSASGRQNISDATTKHGGNALMRQLFAKAKFRQSHLDMIANVMSELHKDEVGALDFLRSGSYLLMLRFLSATEDSEELPSQSLLSQLRTAQRLYETFDKMLKEAEQIEADIINYEDALNG